MELSIINSWGQSRISRETGSARRGQTEAADYLTPKYRQLHTYSRMNETTYNQRRDWIRMYFEDCDNCRSFESQEVLLKPGIALPRPGGWLFSTGNSSWMNETKKCTYFNYQEIKKTKITRETAARPGRWLYYLTPATTRETKTKDEEVVEPRPHVESPLPFPSVQKDSAKENFETASISWGRSLRSVPNTNDGFDCLPLRLPEFSCLKMEWRKEGSRKQANSASLRFDKILFNQENEQEFSCPVANIFIR